MSLDVDVRSKTKKKNLTKNALMICALRSDFAGGRKVVRKLDFLGGLQPEKKRLYVISIDLQTSDFPNFIFTGCKIDDFSQTTNSHQYILQL